MNLKEEMLKKYKNNKVVKTRDQVAGDIKYQMEHGFNEIFYDKKVISDEVAEEFINEGFKIEPYEDEHSKAQYIELIKISWGE